MEKLLEQINEQLESFKKDSESFIQKSNQAAGRRARKATSELTKLFKEFRKLSISESKKD